MAVGTDQVRAGGGRRGQVRRGEVRRGSPVRARGGTPTGPRDRGPGQPHRRQVARLPVDAQAEYERIVNSAAAEVALSRQRAIDEAAERMGEIVLDAVERIIGARSTTRPTAT